MLNTDICRDLLARCGGAAIIGIVGEGADGLVSRFNAQGAEGLTFKEGASGAACIIYIYSGEPIAIKECAGKPYIIVALKEAAGLEAAYDCAVAKIGEAADENAMNAALRALLLEFPVRAVNVDIPEWTQVMPQENTAISELMERVRTGLEGVRKMKNISSLDALMSGAKYWGEQVRVEADLATGEAVLTVTVKDGIFFEMLSEIAGDEIDGEYSLMRYVRSASEAKKSYAKVRDALECARVNGYGIVRPAPEDMNYEQPQVVNKGGSVGIKLRASAPSYHVIRVDVTGEVSPIMGDAVQSEGIVRNMMSGFETNPEETWNTDVFGKSLRSMVQDGLSSKVSLIQDETRGKLRKALTRMVNEGKGGVICIIL